MFLSWVVKVLEVEWESSFSRLHRLMVKIYGNGYAIHFAKVDFGVTGFTLQVFIRKLSYLCHEIIDNFSES